MTPTRLRAFAENAERVAGRPVGQVGSEYCFYVGAEGPLGDQDLAVLHYALSETFEPEQFGPKSFLEGRYPTIIEYGPRLNFETAWSSNAVEICHRSGAHVSAAPGALGTARTGRAAHRRAGRGSARSPARPHDRDALPGATGVVRDRSRC